MSDQNSMQLDKKKTINRTQSLVTSNEGCVEKVNLVDFELSDKIGRTANGVIKVCKNTKTNKIFSMKILRKADLLQSKIIEHVTNEYKILSQIYHPFIIELKGINCTDPYTLNFLLEYIPGGDLNNLIKTNKVLPLEQAKFYLASLITALDYLHKKNIIYRDLKPENVLINANGYIKLTDFGFSKIMKKEITHSLCGTPEYCSPEMINKSGHNKCVDYWGLGILLYEMLVGVTPFWDQDPMKIYQKINKGKISFPNKGFNKNAKTLIKHFLNVDINKRLGCTKKGIVEIIEHPFFENFDWKGLLYRTLEAPFVPIITSPMDTSNFRKLEDNYLDEPDVPVSSDKDPFYNW